MAVAAARSVLRPTSFRNMAARITSEVKTARSPFRISHRKPLSNPIPVSRVFRAEMSFCVESMQPFHTATASSLMTSMLSVTRGGYGWLPDACDEDV